MSLIEKALRQAQEPLSKSQQATAQTVPKPAPAAPAPVHSWLTTPMEPSAPSAPSAPVTTALIAVAGAVLILAAVLIIGGTLWMKRSLGVRQPPRNAGASRAPAAPATATGAETVAAPQEPESAKTPSATALPAATSPDSPTLTGTIEGLGKPYAMINGMIVSEGDSIGEWTLLGISKGSVKLRRTDGHETTLRVPR